LQEKLLSSKKYNRPVDPEVILYFADRVEHEIRSGVTDGEANAPPGSSDVGHFLEKGPP